MIDYDGFFLGCFGIVGLLFFGVFFGNLYDLMM